MVMRGPGSNAQNWKHRCMKRALAELHHLSIAGFHSSGNHLLVHQKSSEETSMTVDSIGLGS